MGFMNCSSGASAIWKHKYAELCLKKGSFNILELFFFPSRWHWQSSLQGHDLLLALGLWKKSLIPLKFSFFFFRYWFVVVLSPKTKVVIENRVGLLCDVVWICAILYILWNYALCYAMPTQKLIVVCHYVNLSSLYNIHAKV